MLLSDFPHNGPAPALGRVGRLKKASFSGNIGRLAGT